MDLRRKLYFWVEEVITAPSGVVRLAGFDFFPGGLWQSDHPFRSDNSNPLRVLSRSQLIPFSGPLRVVHSQRIGWHFQVLEGSIPILPCMLTNDSNLRFVYLGPTKLECSEDDCAEFVGDGLPLCGEDWLGFVRYESGTYSIEIYGDSRPPVAQTILAYCPEFAEEIDTNDDIGQFRLSLLGGLE